MTATRRIHDSQERKGCVPTGPGGTEALSGLGSPAFSFLAPERQAACRAGGHPASRLVPFPNLCQLRRPSHALAHPLSLRAWSCGPVSQGLVASGVDPSPSLHATPAPHCGLGVKTCSLSRAAAGTVAGGGWVPHSAPQHRPPSPTEAADGRLPHGAQSVHRLGASIPGPASGRWCGPLWDAATPPPWGQLCPRGTCEELCECARRVSWGLCGPVSTHSWQGHRGGGRSQVSPEPATEQRLTGI